MEKETRKILNISWTHVPAWWIWIPRSNWHKVNWYAYISSFPWYPYPVCNSSLSKSRSRVERLRKYLQIAWNFYQMISILTKTGSRALKFRESSHNAHRYYWFLGSSPSKDKGRVGKLREILNRVILVHHLVHVLGPTKRN